MWSRSVAECDAAATTPSPTLTLPTSSFPSSSPPPPPPPKKRSNPGKYAEMSAMAQMVLRPDVFDGCKFEIAKGFNEKFAVTHTLMLGYSMLPPPSHRMYQFGTRYTPTPTSMLMGRLNPNNGGVKLIAVGSLSEKTSVQANCDFNRSDAAEPIPSSGVLDLTYKSDDYTCGFNTQLVEGEDAQMKFSFLQTLSTSIAAGVEASYDTGKASAHASFGARYSGADFLASTNYSIQQGSPNHQIQCHYLKQVDPKVSLAASLTCVPKTKVANVSLGYVFNLQTAKISAKMDSSWKMHATVEEHIAPGFSLLFSGMLDHVKEDYKFGVGLQVGQ